MSRAARGDDGTAGVEASIAVIALLLVLFFMVGALRITNAGGDVGAAARAAARAAAAERSSGAASSAASAVAAAMLADRGVACAGGPSVAVSGSLDPGGVVRVVVRCTVALADVVLSGFPGTRLVSGSGVESVDAVRGGS